MGILTLSALVISGIAIKRALVPTPRRQLERGQTFDFRNSKQSYRIIGSGQPLLLVHGSMVSGPWNGVAEQLAESYKVYIPDLPGFGASDTVPNAVHNSDLFAEALCEFVEKEQLHESTVVALSFGTVVTAKAAATNCLRGPLIMIGMPGKVTGLAATANSLAPRWIKRVILATIWGKKQLLIPALRAQTGEDQEMDSAKLLSLLETTDPRSLADPDYKKETEVELPLAHAQVKNQTTYIYGERDALKTTTTHLIGEYKTVPNTDHNIFDNPSAAYQALKETLDPIDVLSR